MDESPVRRAREGDFHEILALGYRLAEGAASWRPESQFEQAARAWLQDSLSAMCPDHPGWVVEDEDTRAIVGVASAELRTHFTGQVDCYMGELVVGPTHEGRGIGRRLVETVEAWAKQMNAPHVTLETGAANHRARRFYKGLGYLEEEVRLTKVLGA